MPVTKTPAGIAHWAKMNRKLRLRLISLNTFHKAGVRSREGSLRDLQAELQIKALARTGNLPPPTTKEGQALRAILASYAPKIGPGRRNIHTLHRKIVLGVLRDHAKAKHKAARQAGAQ